MAWLGVLVSFDDVFDCIVDRRGCGTQNTPMSFVSDSFYLSTLQSLKEMNDMLARIALVCLSVLTFAGCSDAVVKPVDQKFTRIADLPDEKLAALSEKSFYFAHQSVGVNTIDGLKMILPENPRVKLNIVEGAGSALARPGVFLHSNVGKNRFPGTKIDEFVNNIDQSLGGKVDAAFLKFCYVDMEQAGNPAELFQSYKASVSALKAKHPGTTFVHFTLPIKSIPTDMKTRIKDALGMSIEEKEDNKKRADFNQLIRQEYAGKEPIFDIAHLESISPVTGKVYGFKDSDRIVEVMAPDNTNDGGHLTESGKRWIAEQLVVFLAQLP